MIKVSIISKWKEIVLDPGYREVVKVKANTNLDVGCLSCRLFWVLVLEVVKVKANTNLDVGSLSCSCSVLNN